MASGADLTTPGVVLVQAGIARAQRIEADAITGRATATTTSDRFQALRMTSISSSVTAYKLKTSRSNVETASRYSRESCSLSRSVTAESYATASRLQLSLASI